MSKFKERWTDPKSRKKLLMSLVIVVVAALLVVHAYAGSDSTFDTINLWLTGVLQGSGGKMLAILGLAIALIAATVRGSLVGMGIGLGITLGSIYGPNILTGMYTAIF
ncbi:MULTISPECIES: hypothetical protein [Paraburkholderia]|jgi:conjugal transfer pilus assembly protein TraA|uniref:Conjugal transfer pilus assembly protein TraA n=2 Tax=Paraburkholderia TaxID=1822464 RepID=A0AAJ3STK6_9BURK|nr:MULTISPECIES: hypothetical protein [Paraburkholderia]AJZ56390.1 putative membrane protein [Paraburkholderia fungorum]MBB4516363.1 conjugal transfer pilus assembly protein TraA [Paraburkholderia fungorum]MBB5546727.1 conjugal transfer pilus assembly protein TraA [Paraburkholderia fungorum]MBB6205165.1 conjugal transfer pilus assembly protein TraA [Paraburkholderia fungorum]MBU7440765.1 hypothetical protein [Paraburkholderia fungorum]